MMFDVKGMLKSVGRLVLLLIIFGGLIAAGIAFLWK